MDPALSQLIAHIDAQVSDDGSPSMPEQSFFRRNRANSSDTGTARLPTILQSGSQRPSKATPGGSFGRVSLGPERVSTASRGETQFSFLESNRLARAEAYPLLTQIAFLETYLNHTVQLPEDPAAETERVRSPDLLSSLL